MAGPAEFLLGEFRRSVDERFRLSVPQSLVDLLTSAGAELFLAKERPGCLSLWSSAEWQEKLDAGVELVQSKIRAGKLQGKVAEVQQLGRLLSTRHKSVQLAGRGRLLVPEGFREFLGVEPGGEVLVVGAAVCVEIWRPDAWTACLDEQIPAFRQLLDELSG